MIKEDLKVSDPNGNPDTEAPDDKPDGDKDPKTKPKVTDTRFTPEDQVYMAKLIAVQKEQEKKELETANELEKAKKLLEADKTPSNDYEKRIEALEEDNKLLSEKRKSDLLSFLDESDQKKYKDKSVEQLEILVDYLADNPTKKKGMRRKPTAIVTDDKTQLGSGSVGTYNYKTKQWE